MCPPKGRLETKYYGVTHTLNTPALDVATMFTMLPRYAAMLSGSERLLRQVQP